jgi:hypothetical protein
LFSGSYTLFSGSYTLFSGSYTLFSGSYTFDSAAAGTPFAAGADAALSGALYFSQGPPYGLQWTIGDISSISDQVRITVANDVFTGQSMATVPDSDFYEVFSQGEDGFFGFVLRDCFGAPFSNIALPLSPPPLSAFRPNCSVAGIEVVFTDPRFTIIGERFGTMASITLANGVPEPGTLALAFAAVLSWIFARMRGRRRIARKTAAAAGLAA